MAGKVFCDTNIILRAYHDVFPQHLAVKATFDRLLADDSDLWISRQVIREYLVQVTHPRTFVTPLTSDQAVQHISNILQTCQVVDETSATTSMLLTLLRDYSVSGKQVHDANIVAAVLANGIDTLLTLNTADFKRYEDRITLLTLGDD
jgi:predicted nucleic acid-binding protein